MEQGLTEWYTPEEKPGSDWRQGRSEQRSGPRTLYRQRSTGSARAVEDEDVDALPRGEQNRADRAAYHCANERDTPENRSKSADSH